MKVKLIAHTASPELLVGAGWLNQELTDYLEKHPELESVAYVNLKSHDFA